MKYRYLILLALVITSCNKSRFVEITGTVPDVNYGAFRIKEPNGKLKFSGDITGGKFYLKKLIDTTGYYTLGIITDQTKDEPAVVYDVYLEGGTYTIAVDLKKNYPQITSTSATQNELSDYYDIAGTAADTAAGAGMLAAFEKKNPKNDVAAHLLYKLDYASKPYSFFPVYQQLTDDQKNTPEGKQEGDVLARLMKLKPGAQAPELIGNTADGKAFDRKSLNAKVILVEFWRTDNQASRLNHKRLLSDYYSPLKIKNLAMVSYSLDENKDDWTKAIKEDGMTWTQVNDLKGESSPNIQAWSISTIPTYDLLDSNWHIIIRDIAFDDIPVKVANYLNVPLN